MDAIKPVDILVVLSLVALGDADASVRQLEGHLGVPKSKVALSLRRLEASKLIGEVEGKRRVMRIALWDLLEHGARWIAPGEIGDFELGLPTSHTAEPLASQLMGDSDPLVMPLPHGPMRGRAVTPIHPQAPHAAAKNDNLYRLLVIADAFRIGRARERQIAAKEIRKWV